MNKSLKKFKLREDLKLPNELLLKTILKVIITLAGTVYLIVMKNCY